MFLAKLFPGVGLEMEDYTATQNKEMDKETTAWEVRAGRVDLRSATCPGGDRVTTKMLANSDDKSLEGIMLVGRKNS
ncbi:hypothetical protein V5799_018058 [Amblyomma americanum]|uniref:Uncharacterized protein n=1 Tax=Amblyomma americanum TaxID=6943 RepID=A0AAQ4F0Y6_AMBAM